MLYCFGCTEYLPTTMFYKANTTTRGYQRYCKDCEKQMPAYTRKLERSRNGYRPPSATPAARRAKKASC